MPQEILAVIGTFLSIMFLGITYLKNRHRERLALIQYGKDYTVFRKPNKNSSLKMGLLFFSVGSGILIGGALDGMFENQGPLCVFACIFIFGGLALLYYHQYINGKSMQDFKTPFDKNDGIDDDELL